MASKKIWSMYRGDYKTRKIVVPAGTYTVGGRLLFAVKQQYDNDESDAAAIIDKEYTDSDIVETLTNGDKVYLLVINKADTHNVPITEPTDYIGEIRYINATGRPTTYEPFTFRLSPVVNLGF